MYVYFGKCRTVQISGTVYKGSEKRRHETKVITRSYK